MSGEKIVLSEEDRKELVQLYETAETMPVIGFSVRQMIEGENLASLAWNRVRQFMDKLGKKYGFNPKKIKGINKITGEVSYE